MTTSGATHGNSIKWRFRFNDQARKYPVYILQWCHNEHDSDSVSNHQRLDCLLSRLFKRRHRSPGLVIVNVNCQSTAAKKLPLHHMIESVKPDVIVGTEAWLKPDIASSEAFPLEDYQVTRKDRTNRKGGGVFIMARREFTLFREEELETDCELIWGRLSINLSKYNSLDLPLQSVFSLRECIASKHWLP